MPSGEERSDCWSKSSVFYLNRDTILSHLCPPLKPYSSPKTSGDASQPNRLLINRIHTAAIPA